jgi:hypothetical protein
MDSNTHSTSQSTSEPVELAALETDVDRLAAQDLDRLTDAALVDRALVLRELGDRIDGQWLRTWPPSTAAAPPAPKTACRPALPRGGCGAGCA